MTARRYSRHIHQGLSRRLRLCHDPHPASPGPGESAQGELGGNGGGMRGGTEAVWTTRWAIAALIGLTVIRLVVAAITPLAPDETYYWIWSRALSPGYLDHPPMVAWWIRAGTAIAGETALGVRLLGPVSAAIGSILLFDAAERLFPGRQAGITAASLLNATLICGVGSVIMTPDTPLLFFWTAALWAAVRIAVNGPPTWWLPAWWLAAGAFSGLALLSKYTAAFLPVGFGLFALWARRDALRQPGFWLGGLIGALLFLPVVLWNAAHEWAGFLRQGGRVADWRPERAAGFLAELILGQIGLVTPGIFVLFVAGIYTALRSRQPGNRLLVMLSVPAALVFLQHAIGDRVQGNWPAIIWPAAALAAAGMTAPVWRRWVVPSCALGLGAAFLLYLHAASGWPVDARDPLARQLAGWPDLATRLEAARIEAGASFIIAEPFGLASELAWHLPAEVRIAGAGGRWRFFRLPRVEGMETRGLLIRPERYGAAPGGVPRPALSRIQDSVEIERYSVFLINGGDGAWLPRRR